MDDSNPSTTLPTLDTSWVDPIHLNDFLEAVEALPPAHLRPPTVQERFATQDAVEIRLKDYAFSQGFPLVKQGGAGTTGVFTMKCRRHGAETKNWRKLADEDRAKNKDGTVRSSSVRKTDCPYSIRVSQWKGESQWRVKSTNLTHNHPLNPDPFLDPVLRSRRPGAEKVD